MSVNRETQSVARFLVALDERVYLAFECQLQTAVCDRLVESCEEEHQYGHDFASFLVGEQALPPDDGRIDFERAEQLRGVVRKLAARLQAAFVAPSHPVGYEQTCHAVIAVTRRRGEINCG